VLFVDCRWLLAVRPAAPVVLVQLKVKPLFFVSAFLYDGVFPLFQLFFAFFAFSVSPFVGVFGSIWRRQSKATVNCLTSRIMQKVECGLAGSWNPGSPQYWHQHDATDTCLFIVVYKIGKEFQRFHCARVQRKGPKISNAPQHPSPRQFKDCRRMSSGRT